MYYCQYKAKQSPKIVLLEMEGLDMHLYHMQHETGLFVDNDGVLNNVVKCLEREQTALIDTEYYLMELASHCHGAASRKLDIIIGYMLTMSAQMHSGLKEYGAYENGKLPYKYANRRLNCLCLYRNDEYLRQIKMELFKDGLYDIAKDVNFEHQRAGRCF